MHAWTSNWTNDWSLAGRCVMDLRSSFSIVQFILHSSLHLCSSFCPASSEPPWEHRSSEGFQDHWDSVISLALCSTCAICTSPSVPFIASVMPVQCLSFAIDWKPHEGRNWVWIPSGQHCALTCYFVALSGGGSGTTVVDSPSLTLSIRKWVRGTHPDSRTKSD